MNETFIIEMGSGNTCKNDFSYIKRMIDELAEIDLKRICVIKWQLFLVAGDNIPLTQYSFNYAYDYAEKLGFQTTASVFDIESLRFLLEYDIPFVKIANRPDLYWFIGKIPGEIPVIRSVSEPGFWERDGIKNIYCVSKYPSMIKDYENKFGTRLNKYFVGEESLLNFGISDHTSDWELYNKYKPKIYEVHFKLEDSTGLDAGSFARTPKQLKKIIGDL